MSDEVARREPIESTAVAVPNHNAPTFDATDLALSRLRVVGKDAQLVTANVAKPGDIAIGLEAEDEDSKVYPEPGGLRFYIITWRTNYACGYGQEQGQWEEGDPTMPSCAKKQYHYTLYVPEYDQVMPVIYTANGTAAKIMRQVNTSVARAGIQQPYIQAFEMTTKMYTGTPQGQTAPKTWPGPVVKLAEPVEAEMQAAKALYDSMVGGIQAGTGSTPTF